MARYEWRQPLRLPDLLGTGCAISLGAVSDLGRVPCETLVLCSLLGMSQLAIGELRLAESKRFMSSTTLLVR